jgi:hypothetical protein
LTALQGDEITIDKAKVYLLQCIFGPRSLQYVACFEWVGHIVANAKNLEEFSKICEKLSGNAGWRLKDKFKSINETTLDVPVIAMLFSCPNLLKQIKSID